MKTFVVTPPTVEPITLPEAKAQLRIEDGFTFDDDYISALISAARDRCENYCNRFLTVKDIRIAINGSIAGSYDLPYEGLTITAIKYLDDLKVEQTLNVADYEYDADNQVLKFLVEITTEAFSVYATTSAPVELEGAKMAIKMIVTDLYELRTETAVGVSLADNPAVKAMLYPYRLELGV